MKLSLYGVTYHDCPIEARERITLSDEERLALLKVMHAHDPIREAAILQTCNRLEFYLFASRAFDEAAFLAEQLRQRGRPVGIWNQYNKHLSGLDAVHHLFEVAAGLDSQMIGENQILSQVKAAYTEALQARTSRLVFNRLFHLAFRAGKAVRTQTDITCGAVSIGLAAVELAKERMDLTKTKALVIGAGENAQLVATYLAKAGIAEMTIANRDQCRAQDLAARFERARAIGLDGLIKALRHADLVISSTAAEEPILTYEATRSVLSKRRRPLLILDVAVPRDIDPLVGQFACVTLRNIDDLDQQIAHNKAQRSREVPKALALVEQFVTEFQRWYESLSVVPVIAGLTGKARALAQREARRYGRQFCAQDREKLAAFAESLVKKLLHEPIRFVKDAGSDPTTEQLMALDLINRVFHLKAGAEKDG